MVFSEALMQFANIRRALKKCSFASNDLTINRLCAIHDLWHELCIEGIRRAYSRTMPEEDSRGGATVVRGPDKS